MPQYHPALALLLFSGLTFFWVIPISSWWMLRGRGDPKAKLWFMGTVIYALAATLFIIKLPLPEFFQGATVSALAFLSVLCMIESLRRELSVAPPPWPIYLVLAAFDFGILSILLQLPQYADGARAGHLLALSLTEIYLVFLTYRVRRFNQSRALWLIKGMFLAYALSNLSRVAEMLLTGHFSRLLDLTPISNIGLVVNYLSVIIYSFGYWGFVVEKNRRELALAVEESVVAREQEATARQREVVAQELLNERTQFMERLASVGKMAQTGALSASIAHELNQPLAAIQLNIEESMRISREVRAPEALQNCLSRVKGDNQRATQIVRRIRLLFGQGHVQFTEQSLDELVRLVVGVVSDRLQQNAISLHLNLHASTPVRLAAGEVEHVLMNLLDNAIDALKERADRQINIETSQQDGRVLLTLSDNGIGIDPARASKIFDLRESDKAEGMGLGLWLSRHIAERLGGEIRLMQTDGPGARFEFSIPTIDQAHPPIG